MTIASRSVIVVMIEPHSSTQQTLSLASADPATYGPYAQPVKMLVPSSGCVAIYDIGGELQRCSAGYERSELRELIDELRSAEPASSSRLGNVRQTSAEMTAFATTLTAADGTPRGFVAIHLGAGQSAAKRGSMAPSLLRPVLECLAARIHLETVAEHVESAAQAEKLQELEVDLPQGYYYGNPVAWERVLRETVREDR